MNRKWIVKISKNYINMDFKFDTSEKAMDFLTMALEHVVQSEQEDKKVTITVEMMEEI